MINIENIINKVSKENWNDIEKSRYIYIELCKYFSYDEKYYTSDTMEEKTNLYNKEYDSKMIEDNKIICTTMSKLYNKLLSEVGIESKIQTVSGEHSGHMFVIAKFHDDNNQLNNYYIDPIEDLMKAKVGLATNAFCTMPNREYKVKENLSVLPERKLKEIDDKIGYTYKGLYTDDVIKLLNEEFSKYKKYPKIEDSKNQDEYNKKLVEYTEYVEQFVGIKKEGNKKYIGKVQVSDEEILKRYNNTLIDLFRTEKLEENTIENKIEFVKKYFKDSKLMCWDKYNYFSYVLKNLIKEEDVRGLNISRSFTCFDKNSETRNFIVITNEEGKRLIYTFSDTDYAEKVDSQFVKEKFDSGMRTISKNKEVKNELMKLIGEDENSKNDVLKSAIEATEKVTTTSSIIKQSENIEKIYKVKALANEKGER